MARIPKPNPYDRVARGERLRSIMAKRRFTVASLSVATSISVGTLYRYLRAERDMHLDDLQILSQTLQVSPAWIAWGE